MVTDAQARAALAVWNATPGTDLVAMRAVLESFESAEIARLEYAQKDAAEVTALFASATEGSDMTTEQLVAVEDAYALAHPLTAARRAAGKEQS